MIELKLFNEVHQKAIIQKSGVRFLNGRIFDQNLNISRSNYEIIEHHSLNRRFNKKKNRAISNLLLP